jgi:transcriptional regulator with PAS, ATPase and Fis domain
LERQVVEQYVRWGLRAQLESIRVRATSPATISKAVGAFLEGTTSGDAAPVVFGRRTVVIHDGAMDEVRNTVDKVAGVAVPVLILGETGVGKDVVASMLHDLSPRHQRPFLRINCASLPESLLESELFGHERGAFTGATHAKAGLLESANGGTVFLDEIGELALGLQAKMLTAIESREVTRIGALQPRTIDVRFVAATNRRLAMEVEAGRFRSDLFYRLQLVTVTVPPLRDRPADIAPLARHFLDQARIRFDLPIMSLSAAAIAALQAWRWPGNVRELRNEMERAALLSRAALIEPQHLSFLAVGGAGSTPASVGRDDSDLERRSIQEALSECAGNQSRAAQVLRMSRRTLVRKIARLGLRRPLARPNGESPTTPFDGARDVALKS